MPVRVLHIFSPDYKNRYSGHVLRWKSNFFNWTSNEVENFVLEVYSRGISEATKAFEFELTQLSKKAPRILRLFWLLNICLKLVKCQKEFDILHIHTLGWLGLLLGPLGKLIKTPTIYESSLLGSDTPSVISKERFGKFKISCLMQFSRILAVSKPLADDYLCNGFTGEQVYTIMNCVDTEIFVPLTDMNEKVRLRGKYHLPINSSVILFVGAVNQRKGIDVLLRAFIKAVCVKEDMFLLIVGPNNKHKVFVNNLLEMADKADALSKVQFLGVVQSKEALSEIYRLSDIFVLPSIREGLANVVLEAMSASLPIVISDLLVFDQVVIHDWNGLFIPVGDENALAKSLLILNKNQELAKKLGKNARKFVNDNHSFSEWEGSMVNLYKSLFLSKYRTFIDET